jgi:type IV pilus assembly protein PilY1
MRFRLTRLSIPAALGLGLLMLDAPPTGACTAQECLTNDSVIQRADPSTQDNDQLGDYKFFSASTTALPNVVFMIDNSTSMYELPYTANTYPNSGWVCNAQNPNGQNPTPNPLGPPIPQNSTGNFLASNTNCAFTSTDPFATTGTKKAGQTPLASTTRWDSAANLTSCHSNSFLESVKYANDGTSAYDKTKNYDVFDPDYPGYFVDTRYYKWFEWNSSSAGGAGSDTGAPPTIPGTTPANNSTVNASGTPTAACNTFNNAPGSGGTFTTTDGKNITYQLSERQRCHQCLDEAGYYIGPNAINVDSRLNYGVLGNIVFKGNWLNFYPPKFMIARRAVATVVTQQLPVAGGNVKPIRIAVVTYDPQSLNATGIGSPFNADDGGQFLTAGMVPNCNASGGWTSSDVTNVKSIIKNISFGSNTGTVIVTPLAETVFNIGQFLSGSDTVYKGIFTASWLKTGAAPAFTAPTDQSKPYCGNTCQTSTIVVITDGEPLGDNNLPSTCTTTSTTPPTVNCKLAAATHQVTCAGAGCGKDEQNNSDNLLAEVTNFLHTNNLTANLNQPITTYTIGLSLKSSLLDAAAKAGGTGASQVANSASDLANEINNLVGTVVTRQTTFASSAIQTLQVGNGSSAFVPRFIPALSASAVPSIWEGHLFRFNLANEFTADKDLDGDGKIDSVFIQDKGVGGLPGDIVTEDNTGAFIKAKNGLNAVPFWDAADVLAAGIFDSTVALPSTVPPPSTTPAAMAGRRLFTGVPNGTAWTTVAWPLEADSTPGSNFQLIKATLNVASPSPACTQIQGAMVTPIPARYATSATSNTLSSDGCALAIMDYVRGYNVINDHIDGVAPTSPPAGDPRNQLRQNVLGDIFHSSPTVVNPPIDTPICNQAFDNQCVSTLYQYQPAVQPVGLQYTPNGEPDGPLDAYEKYWRAYETRPKLVIAGANDFIVHAFHAGSAKQPVNTQAAVNGPRIVDYDEGTGVEMWGFIPPDQLPRIWLAMVHGHQLSMDGDIMLRDVWVDGQANGIDFSDGATVKQSGTAAKNHKKEGTEYHTVAVIGEREGGNHYIALDVTNTDKPPRMLWMYPPPCDDEEQEWGQSWGQLGARAPPIGPVLLHTDDSTGQSNYGDTTEERWAVFLNGGHGPYNTRGRALAMLDVFTGSPLFVANYNPSATDPSSAMRFAFPAVVSMADYGPPPGTGASFSQPDGMFDSAVVGDEGGQIWTVRFGLPGKLNGTLNADGTHQASNWSFGRAYDPDKSDGTKAFEHEAIFTAASLIIDQADNNWLHAYVGTGDRAHLRSQTGGECRPDAPMSCAQAGCNVASTQTIINGPRQYTSTFATGTNTVATPKIGVSGTATGNITQAVSAAASTTCNQAKVTNSFTATGATGTSCLSGTATFTQEQNFAADTPSTTDNMLVVPASGSVQLGKTAGPPQDSFLGIVVFNEATNSTGFTQIRQLGTKGTAPNLVHDGAAYDALRIDGSSSTQIIDVTAATATAGGASVLASGWKVNYAGAPDEKTVTGAAILNGCVVWNTLTPVATVAAACNNVGSNTATFYQGDAISGMPNCSPAFNGANPRFLARSVLSAPPEPSPAVAVGPRGERLSIMEIQPGTQEVTQVTVSTQNDLLQHIYSLPLTSDQHICRHVDASQCN